MNEEHVYLVEPDLDGFTVRLSGCGRPLSKHPTERDAVALAKSLARRNGTYRIVSRSTIPPAPGSIVPPKRNVA